MSDVWSTFDPLSDALKGLRMDRSAFYLADFKAPWALSMPAGCTNFYLVIEGDLNLQTRSQSRISLRVGDFALVLHDSPYLLTSKCWKNESDAVVCSPNELNEELISQRFRILSQGAHGKRTRLFCGALRFAQPLVYELIRHLPEALVVKTDPESNAQNKQHLMLSEIIVKEAMAMRPGWEIVCNRVADILILQALRSWLTDQPFSGWLRALQEPDLNRAIARMHREPSRNWTLAELAREATMSRSSFAARFREITGETAMQYLTRARMLQALSQLRETNIASAELALSLGYSSEAAFYRAFKRIHGFTPGKVRRQRRERQQN